MPYRKTYNSRIEGTTETYVQDQRFIDLNKNMVGDAHLFMQKKFIYKFILKLLIKEFLTHLSLTVFALRSLQGEREHLVLCQRQAAEDEALNA